MKLTRLLVLLFVFPAAAGAKPVDKITKDREINRDYIRVYMGKMRQTKDIKGTLGGVILDTELGPKFYGNLKLYLRTFFSHTEAKDNFSLTQYGVELLTRLTLYSSRNIRIKSGVGFRYLGHTLHLEKEEAVETTNEHSGGPVFSSKLESKYFDAISSWSVLFGKADRLQRARLTLVPRIAFMEFYITLRAGRSLRDTWDPAYQSYIGAEIAPLLNLTDRIGVMFIASYMKTYGDDSKSIRYFGGALQTSW